jgi:ribosomal protein L11
MARQRRRVIAKVKLELGAGKATPAPPVGRDLCPHEIRGTQYGHLGELEGDDE